MRTSRCLALCLTVFAVASCSKPQKAPDTTAVTPAGAPGPARVPISLAQVTGRWNMTSRPLSGADTTATHYVLVASKDTVWRLTPQGQKAVKVHVRLAGDSIMMLTDAYESFRWKGMKTYTTSVHRMQDGKLVGTTTAHYTTKDADSMLVLQAISGPDAGAFLDRVSAAVNDAVASLVADHGAAFRAASCASGFSRFHLLYSSHMLTVPGAGRARFCPWP